MALPDELIDDPDFRLYVANNDAHTGKLFVVDSSSAIKPLIRATVSSTDYWVDVNEIGPNEKGIIFGETTVEEFLSGLKPARRAQVKLFAAGTTVEDASDFFSKEHKSTGTLAEGDFLAVLAWDGETLHKYSIKGGPALLPLELWFEYDNVELYHKDFPFTNILHGYKGNGVMTWTSSNPGIARVDANGQVTPYNVGRDVIITVHVASDGVYRAATASYKLSVLRGTIHSFHWGTIIHPKVGEVPQKIYIPSPEDEPDLFFFGPNEPRITWNGELENGRFKEGVAYSVEVRLQTNDYPGGNSAYFYANPFTADMIIGLPKVGDRVGDRLYITGVTVTRNNNYYLTVSISYSPLRLPSVFGYAALALDGNVSMAGNSGTSSSSGDPQEADVYAAGDVILKGNAKVGGDAVATGGVTLSRNAKVAGAITESATPLRFEVPTIEDCLREAGLDHADLQSLIAGAKAIPEKRFVGDFTAPSGAVLGTSGTYSWIDGNLVIGGNSTVTLDGVLVVSGNVTVKDNAKLVGKGVIISESPAAPAIRVEGNAKVVEEGGTILTIAAAGGIKVSGNAVLAGGMLASGDIVLTANAPSRPAPATAVRLVMGLDGDIEVSGNGWLGARVYAPNGEVRAAGNAKIYGSLVGRSVSLAGNVQVDYPVSLRD